MSEEHKETHEQTPASQPSWKGLYRVSGPLLIIVGILGLALSRISGLLYAQGMPNTATGILQLFSQNQFLAAYDWSLWDVADFLLIAPTVAVYLILRRQNRTLALLGSALSAFYIFYDISVTELNSMTLVSLSQAYSNAATETLKAPFVAAATYGYAALPIQTVLSFGIGAAGWLLWSLLMWKTVFRRTTAIFGVVVNVVGIIGSFATIVPSMTFLGLLQVVTALATAIWFLVVGFQLRRHSGQLADFA